jgi:hypothetical protein
MTSKLVRNISDKKSREWWIGIEAVARTAPKLDSREKRVAKREPKPKSSIRNREAQK